MKKTRMEKKVSGPAPGLPNPLANGKKELLERKLETVRRMLEKGASGALFAADSDEMVRLVAHCLSDESPLVRMHAAAALQEEARAEGGDISFSFPQLIAGLGDDNEQVRNQCLLTLRTAAINANCIKSLAALSNEVNIMIHGKKFAQECEKNSVWYTNVSVSCHALLRQIDEIIAEAA
jgi:hypothetical protein